VPVVIRVISDGQGIITVEAMELLNKTRIVVVAAGVAIE